MTDRARRYCRRHGLMTVDEDRERCPEDMPGRTMQCNVELLEYRPKTRSREEWMGSLSGTGGGLER